MIVKRAAGVPLIVHDPFFSIWSCADRLTDADTVHWSGIRQRLSARIFIDGEEYSFLGDGGKLPVIEQSGLDVTALSTSYSFEHSKLSLKIRFVSPLIADDLCLLSRPCSYIEMSVNRKKECSVSIEFCVSADLVSAVYAEDEKAKDRIIGDTGVNRSKDGREFAYAFMGKAFQKPMGGSGDNVTIDWGYFYLASETLDNPVFDFEKSEIRCTMDFNSRNSAVLAAAYDDLCAINYFGDWCRGYWTRYYDNIVEAVTEALSEYKQIIRRADEFDRKIERDALKSGGEDYVYLCNMSYRHTIAAHKLIEDRDHNIIFLSKENDSNGCIGTVDVSYPSVPLFLMYNPELVKGMLRPVFRFADSSGWSFSFAPHDVGRYPYAWGQVYGLNKDQENRVYCADQGAVFPPFYRFTEDRQVYALIDQMPVEECGNMLIMTAAVCITEKSAGFAQPYMARLKEWVEYLEKYGADPGEQLCTDDFAGHLSHNVNLAAKAIMGIEAYSQILKLSGDKDSIYYHEKAGKMAAEWKENALSDDHYMLTYGNPESWSLKYNLIWDRFFEGKIFDEDIFDTESEWYMRQMRKYGVPLDNRKEYTKSDWILWCAAMKDDEVYRRKMISPVAHYLMETSSRYPFSDWYDTVSGNYCHFKGRSVQGGIFMPLLIDQRGD